MTVIDTRTRFLTPPPPPPIDVTLTFPQFESATVAIPLARPVSAPPLPEPPVWLDLTTVRKPLLGRGTHRRPRPDHPVWTALVAGVGLGLMLGAALVGAGLYLLAGQA